jgi:hypothetical protein
MARECAFCPSTAKLSAEHIWSDWMNELFPGEKSFQIMNEQMTVTERWSSPQLDWKAKVVCKPCNETWMSEIESQHAKPALADLIGGKVDIPVTQARANSIALFAFKTTAVLEHMNRKRHIRFFTRQVRHRFRERREIPPNVSMWMAGFLPPGKGRCVASYHEAPNPHSFELYVCNYVAGRLVFQVVAERKPTFLTLFPVAGFESLAVPFWPRVPEGFLWPPETVLKTVEEFEAFAARWCKVSVVRFTGD